MKSILFFTSFFLTINLFGMNIDDLDSKRSNWDMFSDGVMGGLSTGNLIELKEDGANFYRLQGEVSTKNNGGFIQYRTKTRLKGTNFEGIKIKARGNNNEYFIHVRTSATIFPWDYYAASFQASNEWKDITLPFSSFKKSSWRLPSKVKSSKVRSIGVVAFGKDFYAEIDLANIELY